MPETLQMLHQSPSNYQMSSKFQSLLNVDSQFNWSIDSVHCEFPVSGFFDTGAPPMMMSGTDDTFPSPDFAGIPFSNFSSSPVNELSAVSEVTAVIEQSQSLTKRKIEFDVVAEDSRKRRTEGDTVSVKSDVKAESCIDECSEKPKPIKDPKPDYIHVRARRGQATDSHSLAERARREKIKKKMQYLQDLVPGCDKVTNKAAMLDEIINYVQYLQKQVEFLSMKLAAATPMLDFKIENLSEKEFPAYIATFPTAVATDSPVAVNSAHQVHGSAQPGGASATCGTEMPIKFSHLAPPVVKVQSSGFLQVQASNMEMQIIEACTM